MKKRAITENHPFVKKKIEYSLKRSVKEGCFASATSGFGASYISPFALALNATSSQIGFLNAFVNLIPSIIQLRAARFIEKSSRKKITIIFTLLQAFMFFPIILTGILFYFFPEYSTLSVWLLIAFSTAFYAFGSAAVPAWFSWMGSLVNENERGKYFSWRNKATGFFGLAFMIAGALALDKFKAGGMLLLGFGILFFLAFLGRFISSLMFFKIYEPTLKIKKKEYFSFWQFLKNGLNSPFGKFTIFTSVIKIAIGIASPFFVVYMLRDLNFSYFWFMAVVVSGSLFQLAFYSLWGRFSDRYGNIRVLKISSIAVSLVPFLWIISNNPYYLTLVPQIVSGFGWAGFYLATNNYVYDSVKQPKQGLGVAYFNLLNGLGFFIGAIIGGLILRFDISFMSPILFIFALSGILSIFIYAFFSGSLREVRHVKRFSKQYIIKEFNPGKGIVREIHEINNLGNKIIHHLS